MDLDLGVGCGWSVGSDHLPRGQRGEVWGRGVLAGARQTSRPSSSVGSWGPGDLLVLLAALGAVVTLLRFLAGSGAFGSVADAGEAMDWRAYGEKVTADVFARIREAGEGYEEQVVRVEKAKTLLRTRGARLKAEEKEEAVDELRCAKEDMAFFKNQLGSLVAETLPGDETDAWEEEIRYRSQPHEIERKQRMEAMLRAKGVLGEEWELEWPTYWKLLDIMYEDLEEANELRYAEQVRSYGWDFDAGNEEAHFASDDGMPLASDQFHEGVAREFSIRLSQEAALVRRRTQLTTAGGAGGKKNE